MNKTVSSTSHQLEWLDLVKAIAIVWIFINHAGESLFGGPYAANLTANWPPLDARIAQWMPLAGSGISDLFLNLFRYVAWTGDHGVQLFLITSGFGLTWSLLVRQGDKKFDGRDFFARRLFRIYPLWWGCHLLYLFVTYAAGWEGWGLRLTDINFYLSFIGIRFTPDLFYYFSPAWWFFGLLLQLYLVFPLLWWALNKFGPLKLFAASTVIALTIRGIGLYVLSDSLDIWSRGAFFITRLPEFVFGISFASWYFTDKERVIQRVNQPRVLALSFVSVLLGLLLSLTLFGMIFAYLFVGVGVFILLVCLFLIPMKPLMKVRGIGLWLGRHSYSIYLIHHTLIIVLIRPSLLETPNRLLVSLFFVAAFTVVLSIALEKTVSFTIWILKDWYQKAGILFIVARVAGMFAVLYLVLLLCEVTLQRIYPMEVMGWGERSALEPDPVLGYKMKPSSTTRLRWESYDYVITTNPLGFPSPAYPEKKDADTVRIMVVGDAFASAEGVDTPLSWPRLLENDLVAQGDGRKFEVLNFSVTGYGPNQYALLAQQYAPVYSPDIIVVSFFVNEYRDVQISNREFQESIGFGLPSPNSLYSTVRLLHARHFFDKRIVEGILAPIKGETDYNGYFWGNFVFLERGHPEFEDEGKKLVFERLQTIKSVADPLHAKVILLMIPASVQVCDPGDLDYYPAGVDLSNTTIYDIDLPQRMTKEIAASLDFNFYDLRTPLRSSGQCPYQPRNMHWLESGHATVAQFLAQEILAQYPDP